MLKHCLFCGDKFNSKNQHSQICYDKDHYFKCSTCGKLVKIESMNKFGCHVEDMLPFYTLENDDKHCIVTFIEKECPDCYKRRESERRHLASMKAKETMLKRYGYTTAFSLKEVQDKATKSKRTKGSRNKYRRTMLDKYGVDNYAKTEEFKTNVMPKILEACFKDETKARKKATEFKNHNGNWAFKSPEAVEKAIKSASSPEAREKHR